MQLKGILLLDAFDAQRCAHDLDSKLVTLLKSYAILSDAHTSAILKVCN